MRAPPLSFGQANILTGLVLGHRVRFDDDKSSDASLAFMRDSGLVKDGDAEPTITDLGRKALHQHERENIDAALRWLGARTGENDGN